MTCTCAARSFRSMASTICSARFRCSAFSSAGAQEGLVGVTFEVVGPTSGPVLHVNPVSPLAPGLLRKFFDFPNGTGQPPSIDTQYSPGSGLEAYGETGR